MITFVCAVCKLIVPLFQNSIIKHCREMITCVQCEQVFNQEDNLNKHVQAHTAEISYDRVLCKIIFPLSNPTFENTQCHRQFSSKSQLSNCLLQWLNLLFTQPFSLKDRVHFIVTRFQQCFLTVDYHLKANFSHNMHETSAPGPAHVSGTLKTGYPGRISGDIRPIWPDLGISTGF